MHRSVIPQYKYIRKYIPNKNNFKLEPICSVLKESDRFIVELEVKRQFVPLFDNENRLQRFTNVTLNVRTLEVKFYKDYATLSKDLKISKEKAQKICERVRYGSQKSFKHFLTFSFANDYPETEIKKTIDSKIKDIKNKNIVFSGGSQQRLYDKRTVVSAISKPVKAIHTQTKKERIYKSKAACARELKINLSYLSSILYNKTTTKTYKGYSFEWVDTDTNN
jgi:hypothetical protein